MRASRTSQPANGEGAPRELPRELGQRAARGEAPLQRVRDAAGIGGVEPPEAGRGSAARAASTSAGKPARRQQGARPARGPRAGPPRRRRRGRRTTSGRSRCPRRRGPGGPARAMSSAAARASAEYWATFIGSETSPDVDQVVAHAGELGRRGLRRPDVHAPVEEERVAGDDLRRVRLGPPKRPLGLADGGAAREDVQHAVRLAPAAHGTRRRARRRRPCCGPAPSPRRAPCRPPRTARPRSRRPREAPPRPRSRSRRERCPGPRRSGSSRPTRSRGSRPPGPPPGPSARG